MTAPSPPDAVIRARKRRAWLLGASGVVAAVVLVLAHEVLLPFVLALVIAYVLTPLVTRVERRRVPRGGAIVLVYVVVLGSLYLGVRAVAPRLGPELRGLRGEVPQLLATARDEWIPSLVDQLRVFGLAPQAPIEAPSALEQPSIVARPLPDGAYALEIHGAIEVQPTRRGGYVVGPPSSAREETLDANRLVTDLVGRSFAYAQTNALEIARFGRSLAAAVSRAVFLFGITLMLAAYLMLTRERILGFFVRLARPSVRPDVERFLARADRGLAGVVRGQLTISVINGILSAIGFAFVGLKYWPVLALVAAVLSLIPIFGSIASAVPAVALGLTQSLGTAVFVLLWIVGIHQLEANLLNPKIMGDAAKIHPILVIFSLLVGEHFFQIVGALLAVPCMSIAQSLFLHLREVAERDDPELAGEQAPPSLPPPTSAQ